MAQSSLIFNRHLKTRFDIIMPSKADWNIRMHVNHQQNKQHYYDGHKNVKFGLHKEVLVIRIIEYLRNLRRLRAE